VTKLKVAFGALFVGVLVGTRARRRGREAVAPPSPGALPHEVREALGAVEGRLTATMRGLDRERRRTGAITFAIAVLIVVPAALLAARPGVPDVVIASVLAADLLAAAVALLVAMRADRDR
jgi:hypothetical protein